MQLREQALTLQEENIALRSELSELRKQIEQRASLEFDGLVYKDATSSYCPTCHDKDEKLIRLHRNENPEVRAGWFCNVCRTFW